MDLLPRGVALGEVDAAAVAAGGTGPLFVEGLSRIEVVVPRFWACFLPSRGVGRLAWVRPSASVPRFGAVVRFGTARCVVLHFIVLRHAVPCCAAVRFALSCRAVLCRGASCRGMAGCAVLRRTALCCAVLCRVVGCIVAVRCIAVRCVAVCRVASCCAVVRCAVVRRGPISPLLRREVASAPVRLARFVVCDAG